MTDSKEVIAYLIAHLAGYVVGYVVNAHVLVPLLEQAGMLGSHMRVMVPFFLSSVVVQVGVFFLFVVIRNRRAATG